MPGLNDSTFQAALKEFYIGPLNDNVEHATVLLDRLQRNTEDVAGEYAYVAIISARNAAVGSRKDNVGSAVGAKLPKHGRQSYNSATWTMTSHYARGAVSGHAKRKSSMAAGAFAKALDTEMKGLFRSAPADLNRQLCGNGSGRAASLAGPLTTTQTDTTALLVDSRDNFQCRVGDRVHIGDSTLGPLSGTGLSAPVGGTTVASISLNSATNQHTVNLTTTSGTTVTCGVHAVYFGAEDGTALTAEDTSWATEMHGLLSLIDDGDIGADMLDPTEDAEFVEAAIATVGAIDRDANPFWQSTVLHNPAAAGTKRALTEAIMIEGTLHATQLNGATNLEGYTSPSTWATLGMVQVGNRTYNDFKGKVEMGWQFIEVNGVMIFPDRDISPGNIFLIDMDSVFLLEQDGDGYQLIDDDGNVLRMIEGGGRDAWEFALQRDVQFGARRLRSCVKITDIIDTMTIQATSY